MGFRGEALASIAAVAQVELKSRREVDELGTMIQIAGSQIVVQEPVACPVGRTSLSRTFSSMFRPDVSFLNQTRRNWPTCCGAGAHCARLSSDRVFIVEQWKCGFIHLPVCNTRKRICGHIRQELDATLLPIDVETS
jgi:DNA mismatch repair protein MutL